MSSLKNNAEGWNGKHEIFTYLIETTQPKTIIEVGSWKGQSTITMAQNSDAHIYCVDTWLGALEMMDGTRDRDLKKKDGYPTVYYEFLKNIREHGVDNKITPIPQTSDIAARYLEKRGITAELIYIDASHDYEDVKRDIENYLPLCTGIIFGDDYGNKDFPGVQKAVDEQNLKGLLVVDNNFWIYDCRSRANN